MPRNWIINSKDEINHGTLLSIVILEEGVREGMKKGREDGILTNGEDKVI